VLGCCCATTPAQQLDWVRQFSEFSSNETWVADVAVDGSSVYVAGTSVDIPMIDCFVRKYDVAGNLIWARQFGTSELDSISIVRLVGSEIVVGGVTNGAFPGFTDLTPWMPDTFIRRYDADGNLLGTLQLPRLSMASAGSPYPSHVDESGIYGSDAIDASWFDQDVLVFKYDLAGNLLWTTQLGTTEYDQVDSSWPRSMTVDASGIVVTGSTQGAFFGESLSGYEDAFVARLDHSGSVVWVRQSGAADRYSWGSGVASDGSSVYASSMTVSLIGDTVLAVSRFDATGSTLWTHELSSIAFDVMWGGIAADSSGVCVAGGTEGAFPGYVSAGSRDGFARMIDPSGEEVWTVQLGSPGQDDVYSVTFAGGAAYLGGIARGPVPGTGSSGGAFIARIGASPVVDTDGDGLSDDDETVYGTDPMNPDTDADALSDGAEVTLAGMGSCPSPLVADSDGDSLADGVEVGSIGTSPCHVDTDGDGVPDGFDPNPLVPGAVTDIVATILYQFADMTRQLPLSLFKGNNPNAQAGKRASLAGMFDQAAGLFQTGDQAGGITVLSSIQNKLAGPNPSTHWMHPSPERDDMAAAVSLMLELLEV